MTQYGAYSPKKIYSLDTMKKIVEHARIRGVKIVPEFDEPAHIGQLAIYPMEITSFQVQA
jgi:hexosaminidase